MRKLTPEERAAKKAAQAEAGAEHVHDENCGHFVDTVAPVAPKAEKPKKKKAEPVEYAPVVEEAPAVVEEVKVEEPAAPAEEAVEAPATDVVDPF